MEVTVETQEIFVYFFLKILYHICRETDIWDSYSGDSCTIKWHNHFFWMSDIRVHQHKCLTRLSALTVVWTRKLVSTCYVNKLQRKLLEALCNTLWNISCPVFLMAKCIKNNKDNIMSYKNEIFFKFSVVSLHLACRYLRKNKTARRNSFCMLWKRENYSKAS